MPIPRHRIFDRTKPVTCHCVSRCVRRLGLLAAEERRRAIAIRLAQLVRVFAIDVLEWSALSNHFHLVAATHPDLASLWDDREVATRWRTLSPDYAWRRRTRIDTTLPAQPEEIEAALKIPGLIARWRTDLADLSVFHKFLKQRLARLINLQDDVTGHCFQGRFKSIVALDEEAVIAHMVYVALNPIRAAMAKTLEDYEFTSIADRVVELREHISRGEFAGEAAAARRKLRSLSLMPALPCEPGPAAGRARTLPGGLSNPWFGGRRPLPIAGVTLAAYLTTVDAVGRMRRDGTRGVIRPSTPSPLAALEGTLLRRLTGGPQKALRDSAPHIHAVEIAMARGPDNPRGNFSGSVASLARAAIASGRRRIVGITSLLRGDAPPVGARSRDG